jgi:hypothetical protein
VVSFSHRRARRSLLFATVVGCAAAALVLSSAAAASPPGGLADGTPSQASDPPLTSFASVPLTTPDGTIQAVVYDGANTELGGSVVSTLGGFTVPAAPFTAQTTAIAADGQLAGNSFSFAGSGTAFTDSNAFPGTDPNPPCTTLPWTAGCLWDTKTYDVSSAFNTGDTSATATVTGTTDCVTSVAQVFATGPSAAFNDAGYVAAGVGLRNQGSGQITVAGIPSGANVEKAYLFWANIDTSDPGGAIAIDGHSLSGTTDGTDASPCWPNAATPGYSIYSRSAEVTAFVTGNGSYTLSGYPTGDTSGTDPFTTTAAAPYMEGASLVVFYQQPAPTTLTYTGDTSAINGQPATLSGILTSNDPSTDTPLVGETVTFTLGTGGGAQTCTGTTDAGGAASCTIGSVNQPAGLNPVALSFAGDPDYQPGNIDYMPSNATASMTVFGTNGFGAFVIGDTSAGSPTVDTTVYFWGSQWAKKNSLSGGKAPSAMKGFADYPTPICGGTWTTTTGNSSAPPSSIPSTMYVIVSSNVTQTGSTISGDIAHVVEVQVNPGYGPDPGHPGTGTIISIVC